MQDKKTNTEIAHALSLAVECELIEHSLIRDWADEVIEASESVEPWLIDVALCSADNAAIHLRNCPGKPRMLIVHDILFGLACNADIPGALGNLNLNYDYDLLADNTGLINGFSGAICGQVGEPSTPAKIASALTENGLDADYNRTSTRVLSCSYFHFNFSEGYIGLDADGENVAVALMEARLVSQALTSASRRHRFEVYDYNDRFVKYLHHEWPPETEANQASSIGGVITIRCTRSRGPPGFFCLHVFRRGPVNVAVITLLVPT